MEIALTECVVGHGVLGAHECGDHLRELHVADLPRGLGDLPDLVAWLPDGYSQIFRLHVFGPSCLKDDGFATLRCKV